MLVLTRAEVESLLDPDLLRQALANAFTDLSAGKVSMPTRIAALVPERDGLLAAMPAYLPTANALTTKLVSLFPRNTDRPTHQAVIVAFDPATGSPAALLDGEAITAARTAAGSALATDLLARKDAKTLAIIGTGVQARAHIRAVRRVRPFARVLVASRDVKHAERFALTESAPGSSVTAIVHIEQAVRDADVVCACTHSPDPVIHRKWLRDGAHVTSVGYNTAGREVDEDTVADALVVVESRSAVLAAPPSGSNDLNWPIRDGRITADHIHAELGELVTKKKPGRANDRQITLYKSVGVAVEDAAATALVLKLAKERGIGRDIEL